MYPTGTPVFQWVNGYSSHTRTGKATGNSSVIWPSVLRKWSILQGVSIAAWKIPMASHGFDLEAQKRRAPRRVCCSTRLDGSFSEKPSFPLILYWIIASTFLWYDVNLGKILPFKNNSYYLGVVLCINFYTSLRIFQVACDSLADTVFNTVWALGCRPFMNSQRAACICAEEEKEEL